VFFTITASRWLLSIVGICAMFLRFVLKLVAPDDQRELGSPRLTS